MVSSQTFRFRSSDGKPMLILGVVWLGLRCNSTRSLCTFPGYALVERERALIAAKGTNRVGTRWLRPSVMCCESGKC